MYGTIARLSFRPGTSDEAIRNVLDTYESVKIPGWIRSYLYKSDADPNVYWLAAVFDSKESYWANARSPEQDKRYRALREILATDPEWHDGEVVMSFSAEQQPAATPTR